MIANVELLPLEELRHQGFEVLVRGLGPANALRFLGLYYAGRGDYTKERQGWVENKTLEQIEQELETLRGQREI